MNMQNQKPWMDISSYKKCRKKQYDIHVCMPPKGTIVVNKFEQAKAYASLAGKTGKFPGWCNKETYEKNPQLKQYLAGLVQSGQAYLVSDKVPFVLCGTQNEYWCIDPQKLAAKYSFLENNQPVAINQQSLDKRLKQGVLDWTAVRVKPDGSEAFACFVPYKTKGQVQTAWGAVLNINDPSSHCHGKGDFVIAQNVCGKPNLGDIYVVAGDIFATTYNNQGWTNCLDQRAINSANITIDRLPKFISTSVVNDKKPLLDFEKTLRGYLDKICKVSSLHVQEKNDLVAISMEVVHAKELYGFCIIYKMHEQRYQTFSVSVNGEKDCTPTDIAELFHLNENFDLTSIVAKFIAKRFQLLFKEVDCVKACSLFNTLEFAFFIDDFRTDAKDAPSVDGLKDKGRFSFKERNLKSEKSTTVFVGVLDDGSIGVKATRDGKKFQHKYNVKLSRRKSSSKYAHTIEGTLAYLELCRDLNLTPFRFITSQRYIQHILKNIVALDETYRIDVSTSLVPNSFVRDKKSDDTRNLSKANFKINYRGVGIDSNLDATVRLKINKSLLDDVIKHIKENLQNDMNASGGGTAFVLEAKVAYQSFESEINPCKFDSFLTRVFEDGLRNEQHRQYKSNREQSLKRRLGDIFVDNKASRMQLFSFMEEEGKGTIVIDIDNGERVQFRHKAPWATVMYYIEKIGKDVVIFDFVTNDSYNESFGSGINKTILSGDSTLCDIYNAIEKNHSTGGKYWSAH